MSRVSSVLFPKVDTEDPYEQDPSGPVTSEIRDGLLAVPGESQRNLHSSHLSRSIFNV